MADLLLKAMAQLRRRRSFYAHFLMSCQVIDTTEVPIAATDGTRILLNMAAIRERKLTVDNVCFILAHEVEHVMLMHCAMMRSKKYDNKLLNIAADHRINNDLLPECDPGVIRPPLDEQNRFIGLADLKYCDADRWPTLAIYQDLRESGGGGEGEGGGEGQDTPENIFGEDVQPGDGPADPKAEREMIRRAISAGHRAEQDDARSGNAAAASRGRGHLPARIAGIIGALAQTNTDWKAVLAEFLTATARNETSWRRLDRRLRPQGYTLPGVSGRRMGRVGVLIDTSGSCYEAQSAFLSELVSCLSSVEPEGMDLLLVDTRVQAHIEAESPMEGEDAVRELAQKYIHGGGTDLRPGFQWFEASGNQYDAVIVFTDEATPWPESFSLPCLIVSCVKAQHDSYYAFLCPKWAKRVVMDDQN